MTNPFGMRARALTQLSSRTSVALRAPPHHNASCIYPQIYRKHPGPGHRHVLLVRHVRGFLSTLPDWPDLAVGLNTILLAPARPDCDGFHRPGVVAVCAQPRNLSQLVSNPAYVTEHRDIFDRLGVPVEATGGGHLLHFLAPLHGKHPAGLPVAPRPPARARPPPRPHGDRLEAAARAGPRFRRTLRPHSRRRGLVAVLHTLPAGLTDAAAGRRVTGSSCRQTP